MNKIKQLHIFFGRKSTFFSLFLCLWFVQKSQGQVGDCPYPIIFVHGWNSNETAFQSTYTNADFSAIWGGVADQFNAVLNANTSSTKLKGNDNILSTNDDDVLVQFVNETNTLAAGCVYTINYENFWNQNTSNPILNLNANVSDNGTGCVNCSNQSNSNESSIYKQGYALGKAIAKVLAANPTKDKVILVGHSMGGMQIREYLQRLEGGTHPFWQADGQHHVAKAITVGTPNRGTNTGNIGVLNSEANRDLKYSYACGFLNCCSCKMMYLYGGNEVDIAGDYYTADVNCDGDEADAIIGINQDGTTNAYDGSRDNLSMPLPTDIRYTYCVYNQFNVFCDNVNLPGVGCGGDGVVDDERQWLYTGGDGKTNSYLYGTSVPAPSDGANWRLSDRVTSRNRTFHTSEAGDMDFLVRSFDEGDFPKYAHEVKKSIWYAGMTQIRADKIPTTSEYTNTGNKKIDGDWFKITLSQNVASLQVELFTNPNLQARLDFYTTTPSNYSNANASIATTKAANTGTAAITTTANNLTAGTYYFRVTHHVTSLDSMTQWKTPYRFQVTETIALPLSLVGFEAYAKKGSKNDVVEIIWTSNDESNLKDYELERSSNGVDFEAIMSLAAKNEPQNHYAFEDKSPYDESYYRLRINEQDGGFTYSHIVKVTLPQTMIQLQNIFPNPVSNVLNIALFNPMTTQSCTLSLQDIFGRTLLTQDLDLAKGLQQTTFDVDVLPQGIYILSLQQGEVILESRKVRK